jgi:hypothetical protein
VWCCYHSICLHPRGKTDCRLLLLLPVAQGLLLLLLLPALLLQPLLLAQESCSRHLQHSTRTSRQLLLL